MQQLGAPDAWKWRFQSHIHVVHGRAVVLDKKLSLTQVNPDDAESDGDSGLAYYLYLCK